MNPAEAIDGLLACESPVLIGVRHHSPALAAAMPDLLEAAQPERVAVELPPEAEPLLPWLTEPAAQAPLAMSFSAGGTLSFHPFADFSPELVALRWAREHDVEVVCIDLSLGIRCRDDDERPGDAGHLDSMRRRARAEDGQELWDRLVEAPAPGASPEAVRRAAIAHGWALRSAVERPDSHTLAREAAMRRALTASPERTVAIVGAFHVPALLGPGDEPPVCDRVPVEGCVVPYTFAQLDSRSGYPSGIRDPGWQQAVWEARLDPDSVVRSAIATMTRVARALRENDHPAGPEEAAHAARMALDLATIRGLPAPSRREIIEAVTSVFAHAEVLGRGRAVADALERVLVGDRSGAVAPGTPTSPLRAAVLAELDAVHLPTSGTKDVRITPLRGGRDHARHVLLRRLEVGGIRYGAREAPGQLRGADTIGERWHITWDAETDATIELAAVRGLTPLQVATTTLLTDPPADAVTFLLDAAAVGSDAAVGKALEALRPAVATFGFAAAVAAVCALDDVATARVPGATLVSTALRDTARALAHECTSAVVREIPGVAGSDDPSDAAALAAFAADAEHHALGVEHHLRDLARDGSPLMQGAAIGVRLRDDDTVGELLVSWLHAPTPEARHALRRRLVGLLVTAGALRSSSASLQALLAAIGTIDDARFVSILPTLRGAFETLSEPDREELWEELAMRAGAADAFVLSPEETMAAAAHDQHARERLAALGLADIAFPPAERWRLILGRQRGGLSPTGTRMASSLDELYGGPADDALDAGARGAGSARSQVSVRHWREEIQQLFGEDHVQEIMGEAGARGRSDVVETLATEDVRPSVELLTTVLSLSGSLPEAKVAALRPLVRRLVTQLTEQLAVRVRPALTGITAASPTRRDTGVLDLPRTIRRNLRHVVALGGRPQIVPRTPIFRSRVARTADWHIFLVVDVSSSMSGSVVHSALVAAIIAAVPALEVTFLAFSTEVIDLSGHVDDPLSLLLEVDVGGGTDIASAVRTVRGRVRVPSRTIMVVISDFEEYGSGDALLAEVEALVSSGVHALGCAALDGHGRAVVRVGMARRLAGAGMHVAAVTPVALARWVGEVVRR